MSGNSIAKLKLSVGTLVDFSARVGDLFSEMPVGPTAKEGIYGHQKVQQARDKNWQSEVSVKQTITRGNFQLTLTGRIDLVCSSQRPIVIEEIKTTYVDADKVPDEKKHLHKSQVELYGYLYHLACGDSDAIINGETQYELRTTWFNLLNQKQASTSFKVSAKQLEARSLQLIDTYLQWYVEYQKRCQLVVRSAQQQTFPFDNYRPGQHHFAKRVYQSIKDKSHLMVEAPTGSGKTMSTLFAGCKAIGTKLIEQMLYLTAKGSAQKIAIHSLQILENSGLKIDYVVIQAKDKACPCRSSEPSINQTCDSGSGRCSRTIGFFDRLPAARLECLQSPHLDSQTIQTIASRHQLCPFELSLQMVRWSSIVICDFNYFLDPMVRLAVFDKNANKRAVLIDEFHNLPDRGRSMYSAKLSSSQAHAVNQQLKGKQALKTQITHYIQVLKNLHKTDLLSSQNNRSAHIPNGNLDTNVITYASPPNDIKNALENLFEFISSESLNDGFAGGLQTNQIPGFHDWLKTLYRYYFISELYSDDHITITTESKLKNSKKTEFKLKLLCLDPADFLSKKYTSTRSIIGFSATLAPFQFYQQMTGLNGEINQLKLPSAFPVNNQLTLRCDFIDTRWKQRDASISLLCELLSTAIQQKLGKYLVFFPSYQYMKNCYQAFTANHPETNTVIQARNSDENQRKDFLAGFFEGQKQLLGFAILGGVFGEGVDFSGDSLSGVIIVGTGMPQPSQENKLIESKLESKGYNGFQYCYQIPGFTRVKQTAGRVIRSEKDKGIVILVEPRFQRSDYQALMPEHWDVKPCNSTDEAKLQLVQFWNSTE